MPRSVKVRKPGTRNNTKRQITIATYLFQIEEEVLREICLNNCSGTKE
jgi:hypothetical protein